jgi:hypothetical protein
VTAEPARRGGAAPVPGTLAAAVADAMADALTLIARPSGPNRNAYVATLDEVRRFVPALERDRIAAEVARFTAGHITTGAGNLNRAARRCADRLATLQITTHKEPNP